MAFEKNSEAEEAAMAVESSLEDIIEVGLMMSVHDGSVKPVRKELGELPLELQPLPRYRDSFHN